jgi:hypothetical protein
VYYIEFFRKRPEVSWEQFSEVIGRNFRTWAEEHPEDKPVLAIGRTWRLGPESVPYMVVWEIPSFAHIDEWSALRKRDEASRLGGEGSLLSVAIVDGGIYETIGEEVL